LEENNILSFTFQDYIQKAVFDKHLAMVLGFTKTEFNLKDDKGVFPIKLNNAFNQIYIYSSIVEPIMVGSDRVPLLKCVWIDGSKHKHGEPVYFAPVVPIYLPISSSYINKIEVNIRDDSGRHIEISFGAKTILTLHFKKIHD
jgi:hypothetical protein